MIVKYVMYVSLKFHSLFPQTLKTNEIAQSGLDLDLIKATNYDNNHLKIYF